MDTEILLNLQEIKELLVVILIIVTIILLGQIAGFTSKMLSNWTVGREKAFIYLASRHFDKQEYQELVEYCEAKRKKWGNSPYPLYWLARAQFELGNIKLAKELFEDIVKMEPEWESTVSPNITKIDKALIE